MSRDASGRDSTRRPSRQVLGTQAEHLPRYHLWVPSRVSGFLLLALVLVAACSRSSSSPDTLPALSGQGATGLEDAAGAPLVPQQAPTEARAPLSAPRLSSELTTSTPRRSTTSTNAPTSPSTPAPKPSPTPTPPPLPQSCLRAKFANDLQECLLAPSYDISLSIDTASAQVTGTQRITYTNSETEALDSIVLRLLPNAPGYGGTMTVTHLLLNEQSVVTRLEQGNTALQVPLEPPLEPGRMVKLSMDFAVGVPTSRITGHGLFSYVRGVMALPTVYPLIPAYDERGWNTGIAPVHGDDVFADVAIYDVQVTAPPGLTLVASGSCSTPQDGTWMCEAAPMRDFTLILGENYERAGREVRGVVVNSYYYSWHAAGGGRVLEVAADALGAFSDYFGPYPYTELDVVETPNYLGGMEYSGLVVIEDGLYPGVSTVEWLTAHEVAHQWWMVVVGNDQINEPWLDEALTQYSTMLYYEAVYGKQRAQAILNEVFLQTYEALKQAGRDMPAGLPADAYPSHLYFDTVYDKGALYFHELRERLGDDEFFELLQTYYERHRYQIASPESFLESVEDVTGDRHEDLYQRWIAPAEGS